MTDNIDNMETQSIKLLVDNALLEQEKRLTTDFRKEMEHHSEKIAKSVSEQSKLYNDALFTNTRDIATLNEKVKGLRSAMITVGASCGTLGGFIGFAAGFFLSK